MTEKNGNKKTVTADKIIIAVGGRPNIPDIPGKEHCITSDDIFWITKNPGKTLVVGASYVALECAGFLAAFGNDTTVMVRSILLRGFDQDMAEKIGTYMEAHHTKFIRGAVPHKVEKGADGKLTVFWKNAEGQEQSEQYDNVLFAIGRYAVTDDLNCDAVGLVREKNGKFKTTADERTNIDHIYAIGDCKDGVMELTPSAIKAGKLLSKRLFGGKTELMDYDLIPTTVFTPIEYGTCGLTEEEAQTKFGADNIRTWHTKFQPLEW